MMRSNTSSAHATAMSRHRAHDYRHLIRRWRAVARAAGLVMRPFARSGEHRVYWLRSPRLPKTGAVYLSAGIHGDEPGATEGLVAWAEGNVRSLRARPFVIFPCLNPWGLLNNSRLNADHHDLNRQFHHDADSMIRALKQLIAGHWFSVALTLHEDYDGQGVYIYEVKRRAPFWAEDLLEIARPILPIEGRTKIDGRASRSGIVRPKINPKKFPMLPEAVWLHLHHSERTFTIETPSEFALDARIAAHAAIITECVRRSPALSTINSQPSTIPPPSAPPTS